MIWIQYLPAALIAFVVVLASVVPLAALGLHYGWVYENKRAVRHVVMPPVPFVGGIAVLLGLIAAALFSAWPVETIGLAIGMVIVFLFGVAEDRAPIRRRFWFLGMAGAAAAAVIGGQQMITTTGPVFGPFEIPLWIFSVPATVAIVGVIALGFRTIDRADGLCDGQALISTIALTVVAAILAGQGSAAWPLPGFAVVSLSMIGALLGLAFYTFRRPGRRLAAVYLGSAGAMMLGLLVGWLGLQVHAGFGEAGIGLGGLLWLVAIPLTDLLFYVLRRVLAGSHWSASDKYRLYHWLKEQQFTVGQAVMITHGLSVAAATIGVVAWYLGVPDFLLFWAFCGAFAVYAITAMSFWTTRSLNKENIAHWSTADQTASADDPVTIDIEAHTVLGTFDEAPSNPNGFKPVTESRPGN